MPGMAAIMPVAIVMATVEEPTEIEMFLTFDIVQPFSICPFQYNTLCIASSTFLPGFIPSSLHIKTPKGQRAVLALWCGIGKHKKENGNVIGCT